MRRTHRIASLQLKLLSKVHYHLREGSSVVTTLIDYYGIPDRYNYPGWIQARDIHNRSDRMDFLENQMLSNIDQNLSVRFIPYYQLHEFEGLLFNNLASFEETFEQNEFLNKSELEDILNQHDNPELINDHPTTAPSKRLLKLIKGYNKIVYGSILAENIGMHNLRKKSPRFNEWINKLENI